MKPTQIFVCTDSMKGSLSSSQFSTCIVESISKWMPNSNCVMKPLSDGGDGFLEVIKNNSKLEKIEVEGFDTLMRACNGFYFFDIENKVAYIELANVSGLHLLKSEEKNPFLTTTYGSGLQIKHAFENGAIKIVLGLGGSATNEAGIGILHALGFVFETIDGNVFFPKGIDGLKQIHKVYPPKHYSEWSGIEFNLIVDVQNVLLGNEGATAVYGIQKGVKANEVETIDAYLKNYTSLLFGENAQSIINQPGFGAAGGVAVSIHAFFKTKIIKGFDYLSALQNIEEEIKHSDFVITGEGKTDSQTAFGKVPFGILTLCEKYNRPCVLISGSIEKDLNFINRFFASESLVKYAPTIEDSIHNPSIYIDRVMQSIVQRLNEKIS